MSEGLPHMRKNLNARPCRNCDSVPDWQFVYGKVKCAECPRKRLCPECCCWVRRCIFSECYAEYLLCSVCLQKGVATQEARHVMYEHVETLSNGLYILDLVNTDTIPGVKVVY